MKKLFKKRDIIVALLLFLCLALVGYSQNKSTALVKQDKFLSDVSFDRVVLYTIIALEQNYKVREKLFPKVHQTDYFTVILNTAKRLAMQDSVRVTLPELQQAAKKDTTKKEKK